MTANPAPGTLTSDPPALAVRGLSVAYGAVVAVHDATFSIASGQACAITGPNGNGNGQHPDGDRGPDPPARRRGDLRRPGAQRSRWC